MAGSRRMSDSVIRDLADRPLFVFAFFSAWKAVRS